MSTSPSRVRQLRLVVQVDDLDAALAFYRDALGLPVELDLQGDAGAHVVILDAGRATLELSNSAQVAMIDEVEVGRRVAPRLRIAFEVDDATATTQQLVDAGAVLVAEPTRTPWSSLNSRLEAPADLQLTLFQELGPEQPEQ
jgi:catechol 2,3-dioxygenase-like lactoylglutathione lyase family enzyme